MQIARRNVVLGMAGLPLAAVLADPRLAWAAAQSLENVSLTTDGGLNVSAALAVPAQTPAPAILLVHEWWGLNDQIKTMAADLAKQGYLALAVDLYNGHVTDKPDEARKLVGGVDGAAATDTVGSWLRWLKGHQLASGKSATIGWCFGGGWSLNAALAEPVDATIVYYGSVKKSAGDLQALNGPVLGHFAERDRWINHAMVSGFEAEMAKAGRAYTSHWYEADHAFANPTSARYDEGDAALAWQRSLDFLRQHLS
ncbi:MAG: dienelactone hydrolase family protein [Rhodospirillaceae bacterium]|jgi:carboxymethylenebutenolidase|nr:dienelactone hydrolase family protein [Rhodospirillaceae bacterium]MBT5037428.1 dienelactone hydrolase family protein [Rhodospirillaceae bacterium]MBT5676013.1 dienelactone hydrolase family protein [Rhodospirillaceae bacterium]MBT5780608.1 dienelactone hydrolase family protein [Rhodospirillaceae bacterium]